MTRELEVERLCHQSASDANRAKRSADETPAVKHISPTPLELLAGRNERLERENTLLRASLRSIAIATEPDALYESIAVHNAAEQSLRAADEIERLERDVEHWKGDAQRVLKAAQAIVYGDAGETPAGSGPWYVEEMRAGHWIRSAVAHMWAKEDDARGQLEQLRRQNSDIVYRLTDTQSRIDAGYTGKRMADSPADETHAPTPK